MSELKPLFSPVEAKLDWQAMEISIYKFWNEQQVFAKLKTKLNKIDTKFSFIDGPITANNPMGVHHARGRALKDIFQRYMAMRGFNQRFQNGFDTQGLWVEVEVEKALDLNSKLEIIDMGLATFVNHCKERIGKYSKLITQQSQRLGQQMDWDNSYYTHSDNNIEYIWYFLKACHDKGWLYQSQLVMPWCPRCSTSLSAHEMADSYRVLEHPSVFLQLPVVGFSRYFLVWTTTPWTLTANTALAVHPDLTYLLVEQDKKEYYIAEDAVQVLDNDFRILSRSKGSELLNLSYITPFCELKIQKSVNHKIVPWREVSADEGTGIVHIAPGCGAEDFDLGKEFNLSVIAPIDEQGRLVEGLGNFTGLSTKEVESQVFSALKKKGFVYKIETIKHRYPMCWRCKTELVFKLENEWFISCEEIRLLLMEANKTVKWIPEHAGKRMYDWLRNMGDWCISRKRFWGLPLPFYPCNCGEVTVIGSLKGLYQLATDSNKAKTLPELHRPWIDSVKITCPKCNNQVSRISEVGDCWLDAGIVPFSTLRYLEDREYWKKWFPADLVCEMIEQTRLWFYSQLFMSVTLEGQAPFKSVVVYEEVRNEDGSPMSKSGKMLTFEDAIKTSSADILRWSYAKQSPDALLRLGKNVTADVSRKFVPFWNAVRFFLNFAALDVTDPSQLVQSSSNIFDQWILARLSKLVTEYTKSFDEWDIRKPTILLEDFFDDLTNWYIRGSRRRFWKEANSVDKNSAYSTLYHILLNVSFLLAPYMPFLAEYIYQQLKHPLADNLPESVHLDFVSINQNCNFSMLAEFKNYQKLVELGRSLRNRARIKLRQPLSVAMISGNLAFSSNTVRNQFYESLKEELNVKELRFINEFSSEEVNDQRYLSAKSKNENLKVVLDTKITQSLRQEGLAKDIVRAIQQLRKEADLEWDRQIIIKYETTAEEVLESLRNFRDYVKNETLCVEISLDHLRTGKDFFINESQVKLAIDVVP
ncbi:MAG: isoleucine--tRNA ligase [Candidatus Hodarchaeota archaeon]